MGYNQRARPESHPISSICQRAPYSHFSTLQFSDIVQSSSPSGSFNSDSEPVVSARAEPDEGLIMSDNCPSYDVIESP